MRLTLRLTAAFAAVAMAAVAVLATLVVLEARDQARAVTSDRRAQVATAVRAELERGYSTGSGLAAGAQDAVTIARSAGAGLVVTDSRGRVVRAEGPGSGSARGGAASSQGRAGATRTIAILAGGESVGTAELLFPPGGSAAAERLQSALMRSAWLGVTLAVAVAVLAGLAVSRLITGPLRRVASAARRLQAGELTARSRVGSAPGELGDVGRAFDEMADRLERQERARRTIAADLSHELRTPVAVLQGGLEELVDGISEPTSERLASLHEETLRLAALVRDMEALAAAEAPALHLDRHPTDLGAIARTVMSGLAPQYRAKGVALRDATAPAPMTADSDRIGQVVVNLLTNALKFTPPGGTVTVTTGVQEGDCALEVRDTGPGIPEEDLPRVFDRFWRGQSSAGGRGLGLAIVAELVRAHGGGVEAASPADGGALLRVTLPTD